MISSLFLLVIAYLMGSICSAVLVSKLFSLPDPRIEGSKNPGATNVLRLAGKKYAALVLVADLLKGTIPVVLARICGGDASLVGFTALAAVIGHMYPLFFNFHGGKGVATAIGALLGLNVLVGLMVAITWLLIARFLRYSSLASIISIGMAPFYSLFTISNIDVFPPLFFMTILIILKHKANISRLIDGTEPKIKLKQQETIFDEAIQENLHADPIIDEPIPKSTSEPKTTRKKTSAKPKSTGTQSAVKKAEKPQEKPQKEKQATKTTRTTKSAEKSPSAKKASVKKTTAKKEAP